MEPEFQIAVSKTILNAFRRGTPIILDNIYVYVYAYYMEKSSIDIYIYNISQTEKHRLLLHSIDYNSINSCIAVECFFVHAFYSIIKISTIIDIVIGFIALRRWKLFLIPFKLSTIEEYKEDRNRDILNQIERNNKNITIIPIDR